MVNSQETIKEYSRNMRCVVGVQLVPTPQHAHVIVTSSHKWTQSHLSPLFPLSLSFSLSLPALLQRQQYSRKNRSSSGSRSSTIPIEVVAAVVVVALIVVAVVVQ